MLESVQCEAKNLKLLLNLKDEQIQMYEAKSHEIALENNDLILQLEDSQTRQSSIEEENAYLRKLLEEAGGTRTDA
jgi:hypothetical protein